MFFQKNETEEKRVARYLVGPYNNSWNFMDAIEKAQDGDTIEFENGYVFQWPTNKVIEIDKNLHFVGHVVPNPNGNGRMFNNTIEASFRFVEGAQVTFEDLWFKVGGNYTTLILWNSSDITCKQVYFEITTPTNSEFFIYMDTHSKLTLEGVGMKVPEKHQSAIGMSASELSIRNSTIFSKIDLSEGSKLTLENVHIEKFGNNTIHAKDSEVIAKNSMITGGDLEKDFPPVWLRNVIWESENCKIELPTGTGVCLDNNVQFNSDSDHMTSINSYNSMIRAHQATFSEFLCVYEESFASLTGETTFLNENAQTISFGVFDDGVLMAEHMICHKIAAPNIRLQGGAFAKVGTVTYRQGDARDLTKEIEDDCDYLVSREVAKGNAQVVPTGQATDATVASTTARDSGPEKKQDALQELNSLIGLEKVKHEIKKMINMVEFNKKRIASGKAPEKQTLHAAFMGNPGTGKTTVARLLGQVLFDAGVLSGEEFRFVEATESDLISSNIGGTAEQTQALLEKARGGILFIDEAYSLDKKDSGADFGIEAINTILKFMEDNRDDIMIIFAGYTKEMEEFLKTNPGLRSRVPNNFIFEDFTGDEIVQLGEMILSKGDYKLEDRDYYARHVKRAYDGSLDKSNGRWIRNLDEQLTKTMADRVVAQGSDDIETILNSDIDAVLNQGKYQAGADKEEDGMAALNRLVGIAKVKEQVEQFVAMAEFNQKRAEQGGIVEDTTLHSLFLGNPGTGKTTVARILGNILFQKGVIKQKKFIEVSRSNLVGGYQGQTALKTREVLESALGGVLFIDEAYTLYTGLNDDFGKEALDEVLKFMEDHRRDIVIIFAGYTKEMHDFLQVNSGLQSRIPTTFDFEDYSPDEIVEIGLLGLRKQGYQVNEALYGEIVKGNYKRANDHSNGRWVRNLNEKLLRQVSTRVTREGSTDYNSILDQDLEALRENSNSAQPHTVDDQGYVLP